MEVVASVDVELRELQRLPHAAKNPPTPLVGSGVTVDEG